MGVLFLVCRAVFVSLLALTVLTVVSHFIFFIAPFFHPNSGNARKLEVWQSFINIESSYNDLGYNLAPNRLSEREPRKFHHPGRVRLYLRISSCLCGWQALYHAVGSHSVSRIVAAVGFSPRSVLSRTLGARNYMYYCIWIIRVCRRTFWAPRFLESQGDVTILDTHAAIMWPVSLLSSDPDRQWHFC